MENTMRLAIETYSNLTGSSFETIVSECLNGNITIIESVQKLMFSGLSEIKKFDASRETPESHSVVKELNACVLAATFKNKEGYQLADLYTYEGTVCGNPKEIVAHMTCGPVVAKFVETIAVRFI